MKYFALLLILFSMSVFSKDFNLQDRINSYDFYMDNYDLIHKNNEYSNIQQFKKRYKELSLLEKSNANFIINELGPILPSEFLKPIIYWKVISKDSSKLIKVLNFIMVYKSIILRDSLYSPQKSETQKNNIKKIVSETYNRNDLTENNFFSSLYLDFNNKSKIISKFRDLKNFTLAIKETKALSINTLKNPFIDSYVLSFPGFIPGNRVKIYSKNSTSSERISYYVNKKERSNNLINFNTDPLFMKLEKELDMATQSIVISMERIDGVLGEAMLNKLSTITKRKAKKNSNFTTAIITQVTSSEIMKYNGTIEKDPTLKKHFFILINRKNSQMNINSKALVIDGNSDNPKALIGSKNWSDHHGAYFYDNDVFIEGPAAAMIQHSLVNDFKSNQKELKSQESRERLFSNIQIKRKTYPRIGNESLRIAENNFNQVVKNTRNIIIDSIMNAKSHVYMEQNFIFDSYIISTLIKRKLEVPDLDIRILVDHNINSGLNGLPNAIFLRELKAYKLGIKSRKPETFYQKNSNGKVQIFTTENHRNTISVDGKSLLTGSSHLSPASLQGQSREMGIQIFDSREVKRFENNFLISWNDRNKVMNLDIENFRAISSKDNLTKEVSSLVNAIASSLLKFKDEILNKF